MGQILAKNRSPGIPRGAIGGKQASERPGRGTPHMASSKTKRPILDKRLAAKPKSPQGKDEATDKDAPESPLLDLSDGAVRKMIKLAKKRGYVTYEQLNAVLPSEEVTSEQIEDILAM